MDPRLHPQAQRDYRRQFEYLRKAGVGPETQQKFINAIREAKRKISDNPRAWSFAPGSKRVRRVQVLAFRMQVFYVILPTGIPFILEFAGPGAEPRWHERF